MSRNEHGHEIIPQHLARQVLPPHVGQETEQARIVPDVPLLELLHGRLVPRLDGLIDELRQYFVEHPHVLPKLHLPPHPLLGVGEVPVRDERRAAVLGLAQHAVHGLHDGTLLRDGPEVVVEHGLPDDVERHGAEPLLHVHERDARLARGRDAIVEVVAEAFGAVAEEADHAVEPPFVKAGDDRSSSDLRIIA